MSARKEIINHVVDTLKCIDGGQTDLGTQEYTYKTNLHRNVYRKVKSLEDELNFPSLYVTVGTELRFYNTSGLTDASITLRLTGYVNEEIDTIQEKRDNFIQDIEYVLYNLNYKYDLGMQDIVISQINTDEGVFEDYGYAVIEMLVFIRYQLI